MVRGTRKKRVVVKEIKPSMKIIGPSPAERDSSVLEEEVDEPVQSNSSAFRSGGFRGTSTLQSSTPFSAASAGESESPARTGAARETGDAPPADYVPAQTDAARYTALSTQDNVARYTLHQGAKADERIATRSRIRESSPSLGQVNLPLNQERGASSLLQNNANVEGLRPASNNEIDRRYELYQESQDLQSNQRRHRR